MKKRLATILLAGGAAGAVLAMSAPAAVAATPTWSSTPGGAFTSATNAGTTTVLKDLKTGSTITCTTSAANGALKKGHKLPGAGIGLITAVTFGTTASKCKGPFGSTWTSVGSATPKSPWLLNAKTYKGSVDKGQTAGTITHAGTGVGATLHGSVLGANCTANVGGTTKAPALANVLYDNGSGLLAVTSTANLKILSTNCPGISAGDAVTFVTSPASSAGKTVSHGYAVKTKNGKETITSP
ncbi:MAG: hypothetical protein JOY82_17145 [Streptosporangiaceae bacterium]|nr:hypothetical protein [Streptosporangiaceae bacterium]MBV9856219.1 hypothetical protein [Streptosporangiaceae bacterium]